MKNLKLLFLVFIFPLLSYSQSLSGIWTGVLSNDSLTIRKDQSFEMALTEYRGKVMGYAYSTFIVNDTLYYIVKRVKGEINGDICEVEDDDVVTHNFPKRPEKGVNVIYTFRRSGNDSTWTLDGNWKTNATKKYYSISGDVKAKEEKDLTKSKLYDHLGDLKLQNTLAFNKPKESEKKPTKGKVDKNDFVKTESKPVDNKPIADIAKTEIKKPDAVVSTRPKQEAKTDFVKTESKPTDNKPTADIAKTEIKKPDAAVSTPLKQEVKTDFAKTELKPVDNKPSADITKTEIKKPDAVVSSRQEQEVKTDIAKTESKPVDNKPSADIAKTEIKKPDATVSTPLKQEVKTDFVKTESKPTDNKPTADIAKTEIKKPDVVISTPPKQEVKTDFVKTESKPIDNKPTADITKTEIKKLDAVVSSQQEQEVKTDIAKTESKPVDNKPTADIAKIESKPTDNKPTADIAKVEIKKPDVVSVNQQKQEVKADIVKTVPKPVDNKPIADIAKVEIKKSDVVSANQQKQEIKTAVVKTEPKADEKKSSPEYVFTDLIRTDKKLKPATAMIEGRESLPSETIFFKSDSLVLALYDNGEVDGDTVSVILNGEIIIEKQRLTSAAFKKTIYFSPDETDSVLLVLYAENLGIYPPNTGLLIVKDGEESYYVRFKADYDRNAAILLRKKLK